MTTGVTFDAARTPERTARGYKGINARALFSALMGCLAWLPFSSAAEAAPFQQYRNGVCAASICNIDFVVVPAGRRLDISNVSCYLRASGDRDISAMQLLVMQGAATRSAVSLVPEHVDDMGSPFQSVYSANHTIFTYATAGQRFRAYTELKKGTFSQFACHISGQIHIVPVL
jgi:hypothetical protein